MPTRRYFANAAPQRTLQASITSGATTLTIAGTFAGWPVQFPFYATLDIGTASAEVVSVTGIVGTTATIVRGQGGTAAVSHPAGATFDQTVVAQDLDEANAHTSANTGVHGVSGSVVGTTDSQTLTNKTLTAPIINNGTATGTSIVRAASLSVGSAAGTPGANNGVIQGSLVSGSFSTTGTVSGGNFSLTGSGNVVIGNSGDLRPAIFTNEAAATTAVVLPPAGTVVYLTAPTTGPAGPFYYNGSTWVPYTFRLRGQYTQTTTGQSLTSGAATTLTGFSTDLDTFGGTTFNNATGTWTCPAAGNYLLSGQVTTTVGAARVIAWIAKNGTGFYGNYGSGSTGTTAISFPITPKEFTLAAGDTIQLQANVNTTGVTTSGLGGNNSFLRIERCS